MKYDDVKISELIQNEVDRYFVKTPKSIEQVKRAVAYMPLAVPTNVCAISPYPIVIDHGDGATLTDIDGNEYLDFHAGFGTNMAGQAHPSIREAIEHQAARGIHYGALTKEAIDWSEHVTQRFGLDWVRFSNSGTEATMDALRIARAKTGHTKIIKIEGGYHGSHEAALISGNQELDGTEGPDNAPNARPLSEGLSPRLLTGEVVVLPFNDLSAARKALNGEDVAAILIEPIMFNVGAIFPEEGYLQGLRDLCDEFGSLLIFDETKTCITIAYAGAEELFGVKPHIKTLGKGIGGGLPVGALGDTDGSCFDLIQSYRVAHLGTFCGNPMTAAAGLAMLKDVVTRDAMRSITELNVKMIEELTKIIDAFDLPAYVIGAGAKGCVVWAELPHLKNFRDYRRRFDFDIVTACWLFMINRGIFLSPGGDEQWTLSSAHSIGDANHFCSVFTKFAERLSACSS